MKGDTGVRTAASGGGEAGFDPRPNRAPRGKDGRPRPRRTFTADYKLAILSEYDRCSEPGEKGALLRREGLYSSLLTDWRRQRHQGALVPTPGRSDSGRGGPSRSEVERLRAENEKLKRKLAKAETIIEVQGKVHELLEQLSRSEDTGPS